MNLLNKTLILIAAAVFILSFSTAYSQSSLTLSVAPARQLLTVDPGKSTAVVVKFFNNSDAPISGNIKVADFIVEDKEGSPTFIEGPTSLSTRFAAAGWVKLALDKATLPANDKVSIQAKINVPPDAKPGGRYFAVYFEPTSAVPQEAETALGEGVSAVTPRVAALVYLRVSGPIEENANLIRFTTPTFLEYGPILVETEIVNLGNYHIKPQGIITLTNMLGQVKEEVKLNEENIFPDASRVYKSEIGSKWMLGKYTLNLTAPYGESGKVITGTTSIWLFPWRVAVAIIFGVIIVIALITISWKNLTKKEKELEKKLEEEIGDIETLKNKYKDAVNEPSPNKDSPPS